MEQRQVEREKDICSRPVISNICLDQIGRRFLVSLVGLWKHTHSVYFIALSELKAYENNFLGFAFR